MPNARIACFSIRSYPPSHFQAIACAGNDSKTRNLGSLWFEAKGCWASFCRLWTTLSAAKKEGLSSSHRDGWWKMDSLQQPKEKKVMWTARSYFYVVGSAEYPCCKVCAVYLVGPGRYYLLWAVKTERNGNGIERNWCVWANYCAKNGHNTSRDTKTVTVFKLCQKDVQKLQLRMGNTLNDSFVTIFSQ